MSAEVQEMVVQDLVQILAAAIIDKVASGPLSKIEVPEKIRRTGTLKNPSNNFAFSHRHPQDCRYRQAGDQALQKVSGRFLSIFAVLSSSLREGFYILVGGPVGEKVGRRQYPVAS